MEVKGYAHLFRIDNHTKSSTILEARLSEDNWVLETFLGHFPIEKCHRKVPQTQLHVQIL